MAVIFYRMDTPDMFPVELAAAQREHAEAAPYEPQAAPQRDPMLMQPGFLTRRQAS